MLNIQLKKVVGKKIEKYIDDISFIRRAVFRDWPYLYEGSEEYEIDYLKHYAKNDRSICVLAYVDGVLAGITTAMPLVDEHEQMKAPVVKAGYNIEKIFYLAESCLLSKYRGHGIYRQFFKAREDHAQSFGEDYDSVCFCGVLRPEDHPFKPQEYYPLDPIWMRYGYKKIPGLEMTFSWKDIDQKKESEKKLSVWMKGI